MSDSTADFAKLIDAYRPFLVAEAEAKLDPNLRRKVAASDLVQQTMIEAVRDCPRASFESEKQLGAWLRRALDHNLADARKRYQGTIKRDCRRERSMHDSRAQVLVQGLVQPNSERPPVDDHVQCIRDRLARALKRLPHEKRAIILWVHMKERSLTEIAQRFEKTYDATRVFWKRALKQLKAELERDHERPASSP